MLLGDKSSLRESRGNAWCKRFALALTAVSLAACGPATPPAPPKPHVSVAYPIVKKIIDWDDFTGRFAAVQDVAVMPRVSGAITVVLFKNGQDVKAGQPLFIIDPRPFRAAYDQAVADLDTAKATETNARANFERGKALVAADALSRELYEQRLAAYQTATAQVEAAKAAVETARLNVEFTTVKAPVDGRMSDRNVSIGDIVTANTTSLTRVVTLDPIWFNFEGAETFLLKYQREAQAGQRQSSRVAPNPLEIQLADESGYPHRGHMVFVDNAVDPLSGTIRAKAEFSNPDHFLTPGMFGRARLLASGAYQAVLIPDESIITDQARRLVYVIDESGKVAAREVETGPLVIGLRVIKSGVKAGEKVVLDGLARLQPGVEVEATVVKLAARAADTAPQSEPMTAPPSSQATPH
ncbi:MAG TPA: efflux RND transporter periplasmic adaptor subunit [Rhizomicrobium sp.]|nr:efflux RND transporter periplasmic adaptor subunit [Rhizomicrobium sp.]